MALTLTNAEIVSRFKTLADYHLKADSGSTTTAVNSSMIDESSVANWYICFVNGDNYGTDKVISSFHDATGTITFPAVSNAIDNQSEFCLLEKGFLSDAKQAELFIDNYLRNKGYDLSLFLTTSQLKEAHIYKTLELICAERMQDGTDDDIYFVNHNKYSTLFEIEMNKLIADYDTNENGSISEDEEKQSLGQIGLTR